MIDLSSQPQDKGTGTARPAPQHDQIPQETERGNVGWSRWLFSHEDAEWTIQKISRWAGPVALAATVAGIGWMVIR